MVGLDLSDENLRTLEAAYPERLLVRAEMILYLADSGRYITGQNFFVDGGLFMR